MADERYLKYLEISPAGETATYYELLDIDPGLTDEDGLEKAYKTQIRKLQAIRTSKDVGWIDFQKETLRTARRILKDPTKRQAYDASLSEGAEQEFKDFVLPLLALGQLSTSMIEAVLLPKAKKDGLTDERARAIIEDLAAENGVTIAAEADPNEESYDEEDDYDDEGYDDGYDDGYESSAPASGEVVLRPSPGWAPPAPAAEAATHDPLPDAPEVSAADPPWIMPEQESDGMPWGRGGSFSWGAAREESRRDRTADLVDESWLDEESRKTLEESIALFNHGARLAKVGADVHRNLRQYFPPANGKNVATPKIRGVSFEKLFETERKTYQDTLEAFKDAQERIADLQTARADELRRRGAKNISLVMGYLEEMKRHRMNLMGGLSTQETLRMWQGFVASRRSPRVHRMMQELASA